MKYTRKENEAGIQSVRHDKQQQRPLLGGKGSLVQIEFKSSWFKLPISVRRPPPTMGAISKRFFGNWTVRSIYLNAFSLSFRPYLSPFFLLL